MAVTPPAHAGTHRDTGSGATRRGVASARRLAPARLLATGSDVSTMTSRLSQCGKRQPGCSQGRPGPWAAGEATGVRVGAAPLPCTSRAGPVLPARPLLPAHTCTHACAHTGTRVRLCPAAVSQPCAAAAVGCPHVLSTPATPSRAPAGGSVCAQGLCVHKQCMCARDVCAQGMRAHEGCTHVARAVRSPAAGTLHTSVHRRGCWVSGCARVWVPPDSLFSPQPAAA